MAASVGVGASRSAAAQATPAGTDHANAYQVGAFRISRSGALGLRVSHDDAPERVLWEAAGPDGFLVAQQATADIRQFGLPDGSFTVKDTITVSCDQQTIDHVEATDTALAISGTLSDGAQSVPYVLTLTALDESNLQVHVELEASTPFNRIILLSASTVDEAFFGFGAQLTFMNQKGNLLPILVQEHGIGRGKPIVTEIVDVEADGGARNPYVTEMPAPHYLSSTLRSFFLEQSEYSEFDLRHADLVSVKVFASELVGRILYGATPLDLVEAYTAYTGRIRALPDWVHDGAIVAVQGGSEVAHQKIATLNKAKVPVVALWIQDWTGVRTTSAGQQLWWNWTLDDTQYPDWQTLRETLAAQNARVLIYINPFLAIEDGHNQLYTEGVSNGYLVEHEDGSPYLIKSSNFSAALIDLTNPATREWIKQVMVEEMIGHAGASGWMGDFGEAMPFDAHLADGNDPAVWHNRFPELWSQVQREAIEEAGGATDFLFFNRSGFTRSPGYSTLFWLGDQLQTWDEYDGIKTAVVGMLSGGVSGFSLVHSDIGGYVSLSVSIAGHKESIIARSKELLMRWMELAAFTSVFRTHEGIDPAVAAQFDTDAETLAQLVRCSMIYQALGFYRRPLVDEAAEKGYPVVRHLFLHYPDDPTVRSLRYQYLLGEDLLVAPVVDRGATTVQVYVPEGDDRWVSIWRGSELGRDGAWHEAEAPLGKPAVFVRAGTSTQSQLQSELATRNLL